MKDWIKKHWKIIIFCLVLLFALNKCTQSCNRQQTIIKQENIINDKDSIILNRDSVLHDLTMKIESTELLLNSERNHNANFSNIASDNQITLIEKLKDVENKNIYLNNVLDKYKRENLLLKDSLKKYIK